MRTLSITYLLLVSIFAVNAQAQIKKATKAPAQVAAVAPVPKPSGPTKGETVSFIQDYFAKTKMNTGLFAGEDHRPPATQMLRHEVGDLSIDFNYESSVMTITCSSLFSYRYINGNLQDIYTDYKKNRSVIDFKKVEKISINAEYLTSLSDMLGINLKFESAPNYSIDVYQAEIEVSKRANTGKGYADIELPKSPVPTKTTEIPLAFQSEKSTNDYLSSNKKILQAFNHLRKLCGAPEPINFDN